MAKKSVAQKYEELKKIVAEYVASVNKRKAVVHSTTGQVVQDKPVSIQVAEMITVVSTAKALGKHAVLEVSGPSGNPRAQVLSVNLVDAYPGIPHAMRNPDIFIG